MVIADAVGDHDAALGCSVKQLGIHRSHVHQQRIGLLKLAFRGLGCLRWPGRGDAERCEYALLRCYVLAYFVQAQCERGHSPTLSMEPGGYLSPPTAPAGSISSSRLSVPPSSVTSAALTFATRLLIRRVPGMGTMWGPWCSTQASASCAGVSPS